MSLHLASPGTELHRVAIIDDEEDQAEVMSFRLEDAGLEPIIIRAERPFTTHDHLDAAVAANNVQGIICDHRLTRHNYSFFNGASYVAHKNREGMPSLLMTQYIDIDVDVSIREFRKDIPVLLSREATSPDNLRLGFETTIEELTGRISPHRKPHRAVVRVTARKSEDGEEVLDVFVPQWNPHKAVRFPIKLIRNIDQALIQPGLRLLASVNIDARESLELYFSDFQLAPEPDPEDGLG
jgi:hypothetical protein